MTAKFIPEVLIQAYPPPKKNIIPIGGVFSEEECLSFQ